MEEKAYIASVVKYRSQILGLEVINLGVLYYAPSDLRLEFIVPPTLSRFRTAFPYADHEYVAKIVSQWSRTAASFDSKPFLDLSISPSSTLEYSWLGFIANNFLRPDDSSLFFDTPFIGFYSNHYLEIEDYLKKYILGNYQEERIRKDRSYTTYRIKQDVAKKFSILKEKYNDRIHPDYILNRPGTGITLKYPFAWDNHSKHLIKPYSLDLEKDSEISDSVNALFGEAFSISKVRESTSTNFNLDIITVLPADANLKRKANKELKTLKSDFPNIVEIKEVKDLEQYVAVADAFLADNS